ncbi:MAG: dTDP-4-dehydrorhamnose reductase [Vicinamibacterales bacterium]
MSRVLLTGAGGLLGAAMVRELSAGHELITPVRASLDISSESSVARACDDVRPDIIINCAAFNDVDGAEDDATCALAVNAFGVLALARAAGRSGATFVHYSTDFVFDGRSSVPYTEEDSPNPRGVYAASKLLGEWFALEHRRAYVLRVESLFGEPGPAGARKGSLATIVERIRAGDPVPVFVDRTASPTYTTDIARATRQVLECEIPPGVYHCVNGGAATWAGIAVEAARLLDSELDIRPITLETASLRAPRPTYCALSNQKLKAAGITMPDWQDALQRYLGVV